MSILRYVPLVLSFIAIGCDTADTGTAGNAATDSTKTAGSGEEEAINSTLTEQPRKLTTQQVIAELEGGQLRSEEVLEYWQIIRKERPGQIIEVVGQLDEVDYNSYADPDEENTPRIFGLLFKHQGRADLVCRYQDWTAPWSLVTPGQQCTIRGKVVPKNYPYVLEECEIVNASGESSLRLDAEPLAKEYRADPNGFGEKYDGKMIVLDGLVTHRIGSSLYLKNSSNLEVRVFCVGGGSNDKDVGRHLSAIVESDASRNHGDVLFFKTDALMTWNVETHPRKTEKH